MCIGGGKVVCVTGGSGFIASWLIKMLLQQGYTVNATLRNISQFYTLHLSLLLFFKIYVWMFSRPFFRCLISGLFALILGKS